MIEIMCYGFAFVPRANFTRLVSVASATIRPGQIRSNHSARVTAACDPHIGRALQLIHERPGRRWTLRELGRHAGLGRSAF
jgi:AraC-like DNA-binding protein